MSESFEIVNVGYWDGNLPQHYLKLNPSVKKQFGLNELGDVMY